MSEVDREQRFLQTLGYRFRDRALLIEALTHRSAGSRNNERLEFLGDALLGFVIAEALYGRFPQADEGQLTRLRAGLVNKETLARIARELSLGEWLRLGEGELKSGGFRRDSILANALEALIGAIFLDGGMEACRDRVQAIFSTALAAVSPDAAEKDPKTRLQEFLQARHLPLPVYRTVSMEGEPHECTFTVECNSPGLASPALGSGHSRRRAEQEAAARALTALQDRKHT